MKQAGFYMMPHAIADNGWLRVLKGNEVSVLLAFARFVDARDGITFVGADRISELTGIHPRNVEKATASLTSRGILVTVDAGGGRNRPCRRRIDFPETPAETARVSGRETPAKIATVAAKKTPAKTATVSRLNPGSLVHETPADSYNKPRRKSPPSQEYSQEYSQELLPACAGEGGFDAAAGEVGTSAKHSEKSGHTQLREFFCRRWKESKGAKYAFADGKDGSATKAILKACEGNLSEAQDLVERFLADEDDFLVKNGWGLSFLPGRINAYRANLANGEASYPSEDDIDAVLIGCQDVPQPSEKWDGAQ
jgi:hypothetical protein